MFCPPGYVPFSQSAGDFDEWMEHLILSSAKHGDPLGVKGKTRKSIALLQQGRKTQEQIIFLSECDSASICGFDGTHLKIDTLYFLETAVVAWGADWFPDDLVKLNAQLLFADTETFTVTVQLWDRYFSKMSDDIGRAVWFNTAKTAEAISHFEGWPFCISAQDDAGIPEYIVKRFELPPAVLEDAKSASGVQKGPMGMGRPPLSEAHKEFERMGFDKGTMSWEQLARHLERKTGQKPAAKTMRDWVARSGIVTASPRGNQGETGGK